MVDSNNDMIHIFDETIRRNDISDEADFAVKIPILSEKYMSENRQHFQVVVFLHTINIKRCTYFWIKTFLHAEHILRLSII